MPQGRAPLPSGRPLVPLVWARPGQPYSPQRDKLMDSRQLKGTLIHSRSQVAACAVPPPAGASPRPSIQGALFSLFAAGEVLCASLVFSLFLSLRVTAFNSPTIEAYAA